MQNIEPCTIHRLLAYQPRKSGDGGLADLDAATEEARLGSQGAFQYNRWGGRVQLDAGWERKLGGREH
jgi:hypothetical protein